MVFRLCQYPNWENMVPVVGLEVITLIQLMTKEYGTLAVMRI